MTGHVDNDNIVQANATAAYRMLYGRAGEKPVRLVQPLPPAPP